MVNEEVWHRLRSMRAAPPGKARKGHPAAVFRAALEQAEQLSVSAAASGYAARPIPLYYALNQAARAIVAVAGDIDATNHHGLKARSLDGPLPDIEVEREGVGLFGALGLVLGMFLDVAPWPGKYRLGSLWAWLPRCGTAAAVADAAPACALSVDSNGIPWEAMTQVAQVSGWPWSWPEIDEDAIAERCGRLLGEHYALPPGWCVNTNPVITSRDVRVGAYAVWLDFAPADEDERDRGAGWIGHPYLSADDMWLYPSVFGERRPHPLQVWYATLYAFSMLARYEPVAWRKSLDVDNSALAVPLQMTLDQALADVPVLVEDVLGAF